ncbi:hypothetical protein [Methylobacterium brachythecii]|nr:hypothetical protein [Methylobacterium brachythecii]
MPHLREATTGRKDRLRDPVSAPQALVDIGGGEAEHILQLKQLAA